MDNHRQDDEKLQEPPIEEIAAWSPGDGFRKNLPTSINPHIVAYSKNGNEGNGEKCSENTNNDDNVQVITFSGDGLGDVPAAEEDCDSDVISSYIGHYGWWQFYWTFLLGLFQCPSTFHIFVFVFQVSFDQIKLYICLLSYLFHKSIANCNKLSVPKYLYIIL